jgi:hypothetical protein
MSKTTAVSLPDGWKKASASNGGADCVMLRPVDSGVQLGDTKNPGATPFLFSKSELAAFIDGVKKGEFDHLV